MLNKTQLAEVLDCSKGHVSQLLSGETNLSLKKLVKLSLALGVAPELTFRSLEEYVEDRSKKYSSSSKLKTHSVQSEEVDYQSIISGKMIMETSTSAEAEVLYSEAA